ncbi:MAG: choice-of-anchor J domain-containing protein [Bacteroidales bacterium]|nr:choice-of-anchor J domain-containing protein [Bacteroidales bacterium]
MLAIFGSTSLLKADEVTIGDPAGTSTSTNFPVYSYYNYSFSQQIYTAEEIGTGGTINSLTMWLKNSTSCSRNVQIYMKNVEKNAFESMTDWVPMSAEDLVATGTINNGVSTAQAVTFTLDTPFEYDDAMNLVVCFADVTGNYSSGVASVTFAGETLRALVRYRDSAAIDVTDPTSGSTAYTASDVNRSVVRFDITTAAAAVTVTPETLAVEMPNNAWMEPTYVNVYNTFANGATVSTSYATYADKFDNTTMLSNYELGYKEGVDVEIKPAAGATGEFQSLLNVNYTGSRETVGATINADFYTAAQPDVVEFAQTITADTMSFAPDFSALHHNYNLPNAVEGGKDAVYTFTLAEARKFNAMVTAGHIALYNVAQPKADNALMEGATFENVTLQAGTYYLIAESASDFGLFVQLADFPPLTEAPVLVAPENGAMEVVAPATLTWTLPEEGVVEYRLLVNTVYNLPEESSVVVDWTTDLATSYTLTELLPATQYFWRVDARGTNGEVMSSAKFAFTVAVPTPTNLVADDYTIFEGDDVQLEWKGGAGGGFEGEITVSDGTATDSYVPVYGLYTDAYLKCNIVYPAEMLAEMEGGEITSMKFYLSTPASAAWDPAHFVVYMMEVPGTTVSAFTEPENATIVYEGSLNGTGTEMVVTFDTPFEYGGGNLLVGVNNTVIGTYKSCSFYGTTVSGASVQGYSYSSLSAITPTQRNFIPKTTFVCGGAKNTREFLGFNLYNNDVKVNDELIVEKKYTVSGLTYNMEGYNFAVTAVHSEGESAYSNIATVQVSGNGYANGIVYDLDGVTPLEDITVMFNGQDEFGDDVEYTATTNASGYYYTELKAGTYTAKTSHPEFASVKAEIVVTYDATTTTDFIIHENYNPAAAVVAEEIDETMAKVSWSLGSMPGPGGAGDEFFFGFENDLEGWTNIDNDGDGHVWYHSSEADSHSTMAVTSHTGLGHVMGESYCNASWLALTPDDYMVTPEKYNIGGSSVFTFWACAQDVNYPAEHFGVAVSTADNTSAADFTTVAEWTLTAKGDRTFRKAEAKAKVRGENTREGVWYQYTVDLSAYAGQQAWIAIRHFNCSDQFMMCVDDVEMLNAPAPGKGGRSLQYYTVYRQQTLNVNGPVEEPVAEVINPTCYDTAYVDFNWGNMETGVYQYGVQVTYGGNHNPSRAAEELTIYADATDTQKFTPVYTYYGDTQGSAAQFVVPASQLADMVGGEITSMKFYTNPAQAYNIQNISGPTYAGYMTEVESETMSQFIDFNSATNIFNGNISLTDDCLIIDFATPYTYNGGNLAIAFLCTTSAGYSSVYYYSAAVDGGSIYRNSGTANTVVQNYIPKTTFTYEAGSDSPVTPITWSNYLPKNMDMALNLNVMTNSNDDVRGAHATLTNVSEDYLGLVYDVELDSTGLYTFEDFRMGKYAVNVELAGFTPYVDTVEFWGDADYQVVLQENFNTVNNLAVSSTGYAHWAAPTRSVEGYLVMLDGIGLGQVEGNYMILPTDNLTDGETYQVKVAAVYTTGVSAWETANFTYSSCDNFDSGIDELTANANCMDVTFTWGADVPPTPGEGDEFFEEFETGAIPTGWTTIDADGDGHNWTPASVLMAGYLIPAHGGADCITSESYSGSVGPLTPDNYLVSPRVKITTGSEFSFWACAQDPDYAGEHYGVAISTNGNTSASDFTTIAEWTMTAKETAGAGAYMSKDGKGTREGSWYQKTVDLSSYAGQEVYVAIRHFNCTDMFYLNVDDARLQISGAPVPPPTGDVTIVLQADDVWGDGSGYQMLLDNTHSLYGTTIPETGALSMNCSGNEGIYDQFSHKIPANADGNCSTSNMVCGNSVSLTIPAGTYDWCITNPTPYDRIWIASGNGTIGGRYDDYTFEGGKTYTFHIYLGGNGNDATDLTISGGKSAQPKMAIASNDCKNISDVVVLNGNREGNWYGYDNDLANEDAIGTGGGEFWWGIMLPAGSYEGNKLTAVSAYDYMAMNGDAAIYQGGTSAPAGPALGQVNVTFTGSSMFQEFTFDTPVELDPAQNVWIIFHNASMATYPAAVCANTGDPNGRWVSTDNVSWMDLASAGLSNTFQVRAYIEAGSGPTPGPTSPTIEPNTWALFLDGEFIECVALSQTTYTLTMGDTEEHNFTVVKVDGDYNMSCGENVDFTAGMVSAPANLAVVEAEDGVQLTWNGMAESYKVYRGTSAYDLVEIGTATETSYTDGFNGSCWYGVRAVAECGESDMVVVEYVSSSVNELDATTRIYPNPTKGDVRIEALGMRQITIVNSLGQTVYNQNVNADTMTIDMSQFGAGMYIVNIVTENGVSAKRISVAR